MSIKVMSRVWDGSKQKGTNLVALLAIADHADDYGVAWPGLDLIAKKTRVKKRQAINLVEKLEASGELIVIHQRGRERSNRYLITVGLSPSEIKNTLDTHPELQVSDWRDSQDKGATDCTLSTRKGEENCTISHRKGAMPYTNNNEEKVQFSEEKVQSSGVKGAIAIAPEPSKNHHNNHQRGKTPKPLAVHVFRSIAERYPHRATWQMIDEAVGDKQDDLDFWEKVVKRWIACGWNPQNVNGMLDHFKTKRLPTTGKPEQANGHSPPADVSPDLAEQLKQMEREIGK